MSDDFPRRCRLDKMTPAESACRNASVAIEALPPDERLTRAQLLIDKARDLVADFVDGIEHL